MNQQNCFLLSSVGLKLIMAVTGLLLIGFIVVHMIGNLQFFLGAEAINHYAHFLKSNVELLWPARIGLFVIFCVHVVTALMLKFRNMAARPEGYSYNNTIEADLPSRTMVLSGSILGFYLVGHLMHFTLGMVQPQYFNQKDAEGLVDVYSMMVHGFQNPYLALGYIGAMLLLGFHLSHAIVSFLQTLGLNSPRITPLIRKAGPAVAWAVVLGFISIPIAVLSGLVSLS